MPSEVFTGHTLTRIKTLIRNGVETPVMYRDQEEPGLAIKLTKTTASWYFSTRTHNKLIAPFRSFGLGDLPQLREFVQTLRRTCSLGRDVDTLIEAFASGHTVTEARNIHAVEQGDGVAWETARDLYLEWAAQNKEPDTVRGYRSSLGVKGLAEDFKPLHGKPLASITVADLATVRDNIVERCRLGEGKGEGIRQANLSVAAIKASFTYFVNKPSFGITYNPARDLSKALEKSKLGAKSARAKRALTQFEVGALAYALEACPNETVRHVLQLQFLSGQRRLTAVKAKRSAFDLENAHYAGVWNFEDKTHHWRALPLTPGAVEVVTAAMRLAENNPHSEYLFPKQRPKKKGDDMSGHINERTVSSGIEALRQPGGVFEKLPFNVATHDLRKVFISVMRPRMSKYKIGDRQLVEDDIEMITHMNEGRDRASSIVYDRNQYLDVKQQILSDWQDYVFEGYALYVHYLREKGALRAA